MKGYWVCIYEKINDEEKLKEYASKAVLALEKYNGKILLEVEKIELMKVLILREQL